MKEATAALKLHLDAPTRLSKAAIFQTDVDIEALKRFVKECNRARRDVIARYTEHRASHDRGKVTANSFEGKRGTQMDTELKQYLEAMEARILIAMARMESRILSALNSHAQKLDPMAEKLEGINDGEDPDAARIEAGQ